MNLQKSLFGNGPDPRNFHPGDIIKRKDGVHFKVVHNDPHKKTLTTHYCDANGKIEAEHQPEASSTEPAQNLVDRISYNDAAAKTDGVVDHTPLSQKSARYNGRTYVWNETGYPSIDKAVAANDARSSLCQSVIAENAAHLAGKCEDPNLIHSIAKEMSQGKTAMQAVYKKP